ncbi:hypothetical protein LXL04_027687 [Taraxacum kok-saghyz]
MSSQLRHQLVERVYDQGGAFQFYWNSWLPLRVNCFVWRLKLNRIPLIDNLVYKGIRISSRLCKLCNKEDEGRDHVFFTCDYAKEVCNWFGVWAGLVNWDIGTFEMMCDYIRDLVTSKKNRKLITSLCYSLLWFIWKERNKRLFGARVKKPFQFADDIQLSCVNWVKNRGKMGKMTWAEWCCRPKVSE